MKSEFAGSIINVRVVEDCIRATKRYTKGAFARPVRHPEQGGDFPSRMLTEFYEVYPDLDLDKVMPLMQAMEKTIDWFWGDVTHIDVLFKYSYPTNRAWVIVRGGPEAVKELEKGIPGFARALAYVIREEKAAIIRGAATAALKIETVNKPVSKELPSTTPG